MGAKATWIGIALLALAGVSLLDARGDESDEAKPSPLGELRSVTDGRFATSLVCALCHENEESARGMRDAAGRAVGPVDLWRSTMMANSARDPFWRAAISAEMADNPQHADEIQRECMRCHAPMAAVHAEDAGEVLTLSLLQGDTSRAQLALDGGSCTLCHQVTEEGLGTEGSYTGQFRINDHKEIYAGHANPNSRPMWRHTGFTPVHSDHAGSSAMCGTCHTLFTHTLTADGKATGDVMAEQTPYLEWRNSVYDDERDDPGPEAASCADCHLPSLDEDGKTIHTKLARRPPGGDFGRGAAPLRESYHRHTLVGGNTLLPTVFRDRADDLRPGAKGAALDATVVAARRMLKEAAHLALISADRAGDELALRLRVENLAGHRFPSAYPSRRAWLRVRVKNAKGQVVFASGEHDDTGRLVDAAGKVMACEAVDGPQQPHHLEVTREDQVQIYEPVMADPSGVPTYGLLRASGYAKDNRLLPKGWSASHPEAARAGPYGSAARDVDFAGGRDDVLYRVRAPAAQGPYRLEVDLLYQVLGARYAAQLFTHDTPEVKRFQRWLEAADRRPEQVVHFESALP